MSSRSTPRFQRFPFQRLLLAVTAAWAVLAGCAGEPSWDQEDAAAIHDRYQDVDLDYFFSSSEGVPTAHPLYRGLKAKIDGRLGDAERHLEAATEAVPDSLRSFVYERLLAVNERVSDWGDVVRYRSRTDTSFSSDSPAAQVIAQRPVPDVKMASDTVTVPFDGFRVKGQINGIDRSIPVMLDTGAPGMGVNLPTAFVEQYDLSVDTTVAVGRSIVPALGINAPKYQAQIDSITIGEVTIRDVHATVSFPKNGGSSDSEEEGLSGDAELGEASLETGLLRYLFDEIRYNYADSTFTMIREVPDRETDPNFAVMSDGWPIVRTKAGGRSMAGVVDTGNLWVTYLSASSFPPANYEQVRTRSGEYNGNEWSVDYYRVPLRFPGGLRRDEMVIRGTGDKPYRLEANFGKDLWTEGTLVLDYRNRRTYYETSESSN
jgi:hypothetical protein